MLPGSPLWMIRRSNMYKCSICKEPLKNDVSVLGIQCEKCGSKVFYKERPNVRKVMKAR